MIRCAYCSAPCSGFDFDATFDKVWARVRDAFSTKKRPTTGLTVTQTQRPSGSAADGDDSDAASDGETESKADSASHPAKPLASLLSGSRSDLYSGGSDADNEASGRESPLRGGDTPSAATPDAVGLDDTVSGSDSDAAAAARKGLPSFLQKRGPRAGAHVV